MRIQAPRALEPVQVPPVDVKAVRKGLGLSQPEFSARFGFTVATVRSWEQGRTRPDAGGRAYLHTIAKAPEVVDRVLAAAAAEATEDA